MYCPECKQEFDGKFCPECGAKLIEKPQPQGGGFNLNLGDANAIQGGLHMSDSHNVSNVDNSVHNTHTVSNVTHNVTNVSAQKTEMELLQEKKSLYLQACKRAYEDNVLEQSEADALERYRIELDLDANTARGILETVYHMTLRNARSEELPSIARVKLKRLTESLKKNEIQALMQQLASIEALAGKYRHDELQYKYFLVLAALKPEEIIRQLESSMVDCYWKSFWGYLAYVKAGQSAEAENILVSLEDKYPTYPADNTLLLAAAGAYMMGDKDSASEMLMSVGGEYTNLLQRFADSLYLVLDPDVAAETGATEQTCAFYLVNFLNRKEQGQANKQAEETKTTSHTETRKAAEEPVSAAAPPAEVSPWQRMVYDASKAISMIEGPEDVYAVLDLLYPPILAGNLDALLLWITVMRGFKLHDEAKRWTDHLLQLEDNSETLYYKATYYSEVDGGNDSQKVFDLFQQAALAGNYNAQCAIAEMYYSGEGVGRDYGMSIGWARKAYEAKNPMALFIYGRAYCEGAGVPKDRITGKRLIDEASRIADATCNFSALAMISDYTDK